MTAEREFGIGLEAFSIDRWRWQKYFASGAGDDIKIPSNVAIVLFCLLAGGMISGPAGGQTAERIDGPGSRAKAEAEISGDPSLTTLHAGEGLPPEVAAVSTIPILGGFAGPTAETANVWTWTPHALDIRKRGSEDQATPAVAGKIYFL